MFRARLLADGIPAERIIALDFDDLDTEPLQDYRMLHEHLKKSVGDEGTTYIFLDEVQKVDGFQKVAASLFAKKQVDLYVSGSNAALLSGELATLLSGRYVEIHVLPLSFREFFDSIGGDDAQGAYFEYLRFGGFPYTRYLDEDLVKIRTYLEGLYDTILLRDVSARREYISAPMLDRLARYLLSNIGNLTSTRRIADTLTSQGNKISAPTVESYLSGSADAFLFYRAKRYDAKGGRALQTHDKYYVVDIGFRNNILGEARHDTSHALENIVYLELLRRGYDVYVGKVDRYEIDFVALKGNIPEYYQVAETLRGDEVLARELRSLRLIADNHPKYLITMDRDKDVNHEGVKQINIADWLLAP
jgi:predicted AAA+ superfamily ATPase